MRSIRKGNLIVLGIIIALSIGLMVSFRALIAPDGRWFGVPGIGIIAAVLLLINRRFLTKEAPAMEQRDVVRSVLIAVTLALALTAIFVATLGRSSE